MRALAVALGLWLSLVTALQLSAQTRMMLLGVGAAPAVGACSAAVNFNARTSGQDATHQNANQTFICNLVTEGVWAKLDAAYLFATDTSANALLNLVSSSFNGTAHGSPSFAANTGFTGVDSSTTVYIDTGFNPSTAGGNYSQNSAHGSVWNNNNVQASAGGGAVMGNWNVAGTVLLDIAPRIPTNSFSLFVNGGTAINGTISSSVGHYLGNRASSTSITGYQNASSVMTSGSNASAALINANIYVLAINETTIGPSTGSALQVMAATIGGGLTTGDITNLCHETNTYLHTIAGVASGTC